MNDIDATGMAERCDGVPSAILCMAMFHILSGVKLFIFIVKYAFCVVNNRESTTLKRENSFQIVYSG